MGGCSVALEYFTRPLLGENGACPLSFACVAVLSNHLFTGAPFPLLSLPLQHGRIAMLAICGLVAPEFVRVPGEIFQNVSVLDAHNVMVSIVVVYSWCGASCMSSRCSLCVNRFRFHLRDLSENGHE